MRILDRYYLGLFLTATAVFLGVFLALSIVVDFVSRVDHFLELKNVDLASLILEYYGYRIPFFLIYLLPAVTLFGAMFAFTRFIASNEIVPVLISGISMRRVALPFMAVAAGMGLATAAIEEWVMPQVSQKIAETEGMVKEENIIHNVAVRDSEGRHFFLARYEIGRREMSDAAITLIGREGWIETLIVAKKGVWNAERQVWILTSGKVYRYASDFGRTSSVIEPEGFEMEGSLKPADVVSGARGSTGQSLTFVELLRLCEKYPWNPFLRIQLHMKFAFPLSGVLLMLTGLPLIVGGGSKSVFRGLFLCLIVTILFYTTQFFFLDLGKIGLLSPAAAVWIPIALFSGLGLLFFLNMRT